MITFITSKWCSLWIMEVHVNQTVKPDIDRFGSSLGGQCGWFQICNQYYFVLGNSSRASELKSLFSQK